MVQEPALMGDVFMTLPVWESGVMRSLSPCTTPGPPQWVVMEAHELYSNWNLPQPQLPIESFQSQMFIKLRL